MKHDSKERKIVSEWTAPGAGIQLFDSNFSSIGRLVLRFLFCMPPSLRESLLFGTSRICFPLQKAVQLALGGAVMVRIQFTEGPLQGHLFECWSSEKYFFVGTSFEREVQKVLSEIVKPGDVVYDVGSHAGYMALFFSTLCGRDGRVFAFEPSPINFPRLRRHAELNKKHNLTPVNLAASDVEGAALLNEKGSESSVVCKPQSKEGFSQIRTIRLDDFVYRDHHPLPNLLKIDVEGHAGRCLAGMSRLLRDVRPSLLCELHHTEEATAVSRALREHSYEISDIDAPGEFPRRVLAKPC